MTTIAYRDGILATDKQASDCGLKSKASIKLQVYDDRVFAVAGTLVRGLKFIDWIRSSPRSDEAPKLKDTVVVEMNLKTGKCTLWEGDYPMPVEDTYYAWGSGGHLALGALEMGATAEEAVRVAAKWDEGTGKGVQTASKKG